MSVCLCWKRLLTSPVSDGADCPRAWLLMRTRLFTSPPADAPPMAPGPPKPPEAPCQASWLTPVCRLLDRGSSCLPAGKLEESVIFLNTENTSVLRKAEVQPTVHFCSCSFTWDYYHHMTSVWWNIVVNLWWNFHFTDYGWGRLGQD